MNGLVSDIKYQFLQRYGAVAQIIVLYGLLFSVNSLLYIIFMLMNASDSYIAITTWLALPSDMELLLYRPWTILTHHFLAFPKDILSVIFNFLCVFGFGRIYQIYVGNFRLWFTFLLGVLGGAIFFLLMMNILPVFQNHTFIWYGMTAGIPAIIAASAVIAPNMPISLLLFGTVPLKWIAFFVIFIDMIMIPLGYAESQFAQLGGAAVGIAYAWSYTKGKDWSNFFRAKPKIYQPQMTIHKTQAHTIPTQAEIDRILDKIAAEGYDKLTQEEKRTLYRASQQD